MREDVVLIYIFLCRHGETVWNLQKRKQGHKDSKLTNKGITQAKALGKFLYKINSEVRVSPLGRAIQTAKIAFKNSDRSFSIDDRLKEVSYGCFEGLTQSEIDQNYKNLYARFKSSNYYSKLLGGETYNDISIRIKNFLSEINKSKNLIIIAHEDINRVLATVILNKNKDFFLKFNQQNNIVYIIENHSIIKSVELHEDGVIL